MGFDGDLTLDMDRAEDILNYEIQEEKLPSFSRPYPDGTPGVHTGLWAEDEDDDDEFSDSGFDDFMNELMPGSFPDEMMDGIPSEALAVLLEIMLKYADHNGDLPSPDEIQRKDPKLMQRFIEAMGPVLNDGLFDDFFSGGFKEGRGRGKKGKNRR
jgi:hypothetical protein